jgi:hypothetical protein
LALAAGKEAFMGIRRSDFRAALRAVRPRGVSLAFSAGLALLSFSAAFWFTASHPRRAAAQAVLSVRPFVATISKVYYDPSGALSVREEIRYARTASRTTAITPRQTYPLDRPMLAQILDNDREAELFLEPVTRSVTSIPYSRSDQNGFIAGVWEETCPKDDKEMTVLPGGPVLFGYSTLHVVKKWNSNRTTERWMAPELECFSLKEVDILSAARDEIAVTSIQEGEPSIDLLRPPAGYTERSPAEVESLYKATTGARSLWGETLARRLEAQYRAGRPR